MIYEPLYVGLQPQLRGRGNAAEEGELDSGVFPGIINATRPTGESYLSRYA